MSIFMNGHNQDTGGRFIKFEAGTNVKEDINEGNEDLIQKIFHQVGIRSINQAGGAKWKELSPGLDLPEANYTCVEADM